MNDKDFKREIRIGSPDELPQAAAEFLEALGDRTVAAFHGPMGAGKTTFIKAICERLGVEDMVNSPTFAIVNQYDAADGRAVYHFDFYRVKSAAEAIDLGLYDYLSSGCLCLMEWPEVIEDLLGDEAADVFISEEADGSRMLRF